jgi:hypothetical protein
LALPEKHHRLLQILIHHYFQSKELQKSGEELLLAQIENHDPLKLGRIEDWVYLQIMQMHK